MKIIFAAILAFASTAFSPTLAEQAHTLEDIAFLEGAWRGGDDFVFEEIWSEPGGGVMTGMARGHQNGELRVLEYIIVMQTDSGLEMRFKHFNKDFSTWEENGPIILQLTNAETKDVTFTADPPSEAVKSIRYWQPTADTLQADVVLVEDGEEGGFSLSFSKAD